MDRLDRLAVDHGEGGPQDFVTLDQKAEAILHDLNVDHARDLIAAHDSAGAWADFRNVPDTLLERLQRHRADSGNCRERPKSRTCVAAA